MTEPSHAPAPARLLDESFTLPLAPPLDEHRVWLERVAPLLDGVAENVVDICAYGFTEMLNNVIDHSGGTTVVIRFVRTAADVELRIADDGVGVFHKIATELHLDDERHAVLELSKGKLTTAATMHSGEGIFFTSRMFDRFSLTSGDVSLVCRADERWTLAHDAPEERPPVSKPGTVVEMRIALTSARSQKEVFDRFSAPLEEGYDFNRTQVPVALSRHAEEKLISRSQAKRLLARFDRFKDVVLDFTDVQTVGQAFADEVFRVFAGMHPDVKITWTGAVPDVERMIRRAIAARSATGNLPEAQAPVAPSKKMLVVSLARLPATGRDLFGRESELAWLDACWSEGVRVAAIVGWGGMGKSALVNAWLRRMADEGWRGAERVFAWSFYSQGTDRPASSDDFFSEALRWFGDMEAAPVSPWEKGERLATLVSKERALLILDGVEPLQWGPGVEEGKLKDPALLTLVKELSAQNRGLAIVTSRVALVDMVGVDDDKVRSLPLDQLSPEAGADLLDARGVKGTDEELREAAREYEGHALALTLLGSYLADVAGGDIRRRKEIGPLQEGERFGGHARRVMKAYGSWLEKPELAILHMIGLFDRPAEEDEIAALRAEPAVPGLTDALVGIDGRAWKRAVAKLGRVGLLAEQDKKLDAHPLVREHFGEQLKREQPEAWKEGHRRLYEYLKRKAKPLPETIEEMAPLYAAMVHGCQAGRHREVLIEILWKRIRRKEEAFSLDKLGAFSCEVAALAALFDPPWERVRSGLSEPDQGWVLNAAGMVLRALGRLPEAMSLLRLATDHAIAQEDWEHAAAAASNLSELLQARGQLGEAETVARHSVEHADMNGEDFQRIVNRTTFAAALHALGRLDEAGALFEDAERMQEKRQPNYPRLYSLPGFRYCDFLLDNGLEVKVLERTTKFFEWRNPRDSLLDIALDHLACGRANLLATKCGTGGDLAQAAFQLQQAVDRLRYATVQEMLPYGLLARAALHTHTRAFDLARKDLSEALTLATRCGFRLHEADAHLGLARLSLAEGAPAAAREHLSLAHTLIETTGYHRRDGELAELTAACG
jgi:tetratricopeptide (TPR) repeat protein/anti-sigma regulatory factor (Ser/Thr protein kinase)